MKKLHLFIIYSALFLSIALSVIVVLQYRQIGSLTTKIKVIEREVSSNESDINYLQMDVSEMKDMDSDLESRVDDLENRQIVVTYE